MVFMLMIMNVSYMPFYFFTLFMIVISVLAVIYYSWVPLFTVRLMSFTKKYWPVCIFSFVMLVTSALPLVLYKFIDAQGEHISPARHPCGQEESLEDCLHLRSQLAFAEVGYYGTLGERIKGGRLFSHLDKFSYYSDDMFYIPLVAFLFLVISLAAAYDRRRLALTLITVVLFLTALGGATPLHPWLFKHVFWFKYFRNFFFFTAFLIPLIILLCVFQLKAFMDMGETWSKRKLACLVFVLIGHGGFIAFLNFQENVLSASYLTVLLSGIVWSTFILGWMRSRWILLGIILCLTVIEPIVVLRSYARHASSVQTIVDGQRAECKFKFTRPKQNMENSALFWRSDSGYDLFLHLMRLKDTSGRLVRSPDSVIGDPYFLSQRMSQDLFNRYIEYKFILYDSVQSVDSGAKLLALFEDILKNDRNLALVSNVDAKLEIFKPVVLSKPMRIKEETDSFHVNNFTVNEIIFNVNFSKPKFLVYNDAFSQNWKLWINGRSEKIYKANLGFKGIYLPAGPNHVELRFVPPGGELVYCAVMGLMALVFFIVFKKYWSFCAQPAVQIKSDCLEQQLFINRSWIVFLVVGFICFRAVDVSLIHALRKAYLETISVRLGKGQSSLDESNYNDYVSHLNSKSKGN